MGFQLSDLTSGMAGGATVGFMGGIQQRVSERVSQFRDPTKPHKQELNKAARDYARAEEIYRRASEEEKKKLLPVLEDLHKSVKTHNENLEKEEAQEKLKGIETRGDRVKLGFKGFLGSEESNLLATVGNWKVFGGAIAGIFASIIENLEVMSSLSEETGMFVGTISDEYTKMARRSADLVTSEEDLYTRVSERYSLLINLRRQMGDILSVSDRTLDTIAHFPNIIGLSHEESVTLLTTLRGINGQSVEFNTNLIKSMAIMADRNMVTFRDLMDDVQNNADFFATYSGEGADELLKASIYARRMGVELGMISGILENFIGIETSLESQVRLSTILGKQFDFLTISAQMFHGETMEGMKTLLDNLRLINEEQMRSPFVRQQLSQELGVSVQELNRLHKAAREFRDEDILIDMRVSDQLENFQERWNQIGFGRIRQSFMKNVVSPLSNLLAENHVQLQRFIGIIEEMTEWLGDAISGLIQTSIDIIDQLADFSGVFGYLFGREGVLGRGGAIVTSLGIIYGGVQGLVALMNRANTLRLAGLQQDSVRNQILSIIAGGVGKTGISIVDPKTSTFGKGMRWGMGALGATLIASQVISQLRKDEEDKQERTTGGALMNALMMGSFGAMLGQAIPIVGPGIGAVAGGAIGLGTYYMSTTPSNRNQRDSGRVRPEHDFTGREMFGDTISDNRTQITNNTSTTDITRNTTNNRNIANNFGDRREETQITNNEITNQPIASLEDQPSTDNQIRRQRRNIPSERIDRREYFGHVKDSDKIFTEQQADMIGRFVAKYAKDPTTNIQIQDNWKHNFLVNEVGVA